MLNENEGRLLDAATTLAGTLGAADSHTVAAATMDVDGGIHTGVNVFHFTGGPCAELVAIGAAAAAGAGSLALMVAVGADGRGVMAPCGRCRQVLLDLHPEVRVILAEGSDLVTKPVRELLPLSYSPPTA